ncbi:DUF2785 domain-containing protein [Arenimonas sp. MALMAid1274]|uniref:DUF2785 domain-containing protein n=1 Tax=Arenimonas sp. MALMAid1274 TaxID=3411630 RepID=UPI003B9DED94
MAITPRALLLACLLAPAAATLAACPPAGQDRASLAALKAKAFQVDDDAARQALALALVDCLADPDPSLRDGIAYESLAAWLRADALDRATREQLLAVLLPRIDPAAADPDGFGAPFAALVMSELARTDRVSAWLTPAQRASLVEASARYLEGVRDYRGFDDREGWRHGVAHGADLLMQLALNPALDKRQLSRELEAVASQVAPPGAPAYHHGEAERLSRPVLFVLQRGLHDEPEWSAWITRITAPAPMKAWSEAYGSEAGLARRHNTRMFLLALYVGLRESGSEPLQARVPAVVAGLRAVD